MKVMLGKLTTVAQLGVIFWLLSFSSALAQSSVSLVRSPQAYSEWLAKLELLDEGSDRSLNFELVSQLNLLNQSIQTPEDISTFRRWEGDDAIVKRLIPLAGGDWSEYRVPATLVLGNVVDNTNVCHPIAYLSTARDISPSGQFNLLQVVLQVAPYAYDDTARWILTLVENKLNETMKSEDFERTRDLLLRTRERILNRTSGAGSTLAEVAADRYRDCISVLPASFEGSLASQDAVADLTIDGIREQLFSPERLEFAHYLGVLYEEGNAAERSLLLEKLVGAIIGQKQDPERRYRVNLYIALTLGQAEMAEALTLPEQQQALLGLKASAEYEEDSTFRARVDEAILRQNLS